MKAAESSWQEAITAVARERARIARLKSAQSLLLSAHPSFTTLDRHFTIYLNRCEQGIYLSGSLHSDAEDFQFERLTLPLSITYEILLLIAKHLDKGTQAA